MLAVQAVDGLDEAIVAANCTEYALVAGIYTRDLSKAYRYARAVDAGQVYINEYFAGGIEVPFGGNLQVRLPGRGEGHGRPALLPQAEERRRPDLTGRPSAAVTPEIEPDAGAALRRVVAQLGPEAPGHRLDDAGAGARCRAPYPRRASLSRHPR